MYVFMFGQESISRWSYISNSQREDPRFHSCNSSIYLSVTLESFDSLCAGKSSQRFFLLPISFWGLFRRVKIETLYLLQHFLVLDQLDLFTGTPSRRLFPPTIYTSYIVVLEYAFDTDSLMSADRH
jgi:hypothetical protein